MSGGLVSVIVPIKNSAGTIDMCLRLIRDLLIERFDRRFLGIKLRNQPILRLGAKNE
jgi:hypothetical protein